MDQLNVRLFGRLNVECAGRTLGSRDFGGIKPRQIFEILVLSRGHAVPKDKLADMLWGELLPQNVSGALETYVSVLRRNLCPEGREGHLVIVTEPEAYRLSSDLVDVDLDRFDDLLAQAAAANGAARGHLESAIELARGDVLEDEPYAEWVMPVRERYQERRLQALADAGSAALAHADHEAALAHAAAAIQLDSVNEPAYRVMMLAYNALDRPQDALRAFDRCRRELERVLETTPSQATERLYLAIRDHEDPATPAEGTSEHAASAPPKKNGSHLLGRTKELETLENTIATSLAGSFALAFVEGEPGIGKSRLIHEAVAGVNGGTRIGKASCSQLERSVPYAGLAFALREALDGLELEPVCAAALGRILPELAVDNTRVDDARALEALVSVVRSLGKLVLVLDDLQHADAATITAISYLSRRCQGMPLTIVAGFRGEEVELDDPLRALEPTVTVRLEPLSRRELAAAGVGGLYDRTGGHPLLVAALMSTEGEGELPQQTAQLLLKRCRAQGLFAFRLLTAASVLSQPFSPEVLSMITETGELQVAEALETLCERGLLQVQGLCFMFRFPVLGDVLRRSLTPFARTLFTARAETAGVDEDESMLAVEAS